MKNVHFDRKMFEKLLGLASDDKIITQTYEKLAAIGLRFGPAFQSLEKVWKTEKQGMLSKVKVPPIASTLEGRNDHSQHYILHPAVLDAMIQAVMIQNHSDKIKKKLYVPISISKFLWLANSQGEELYVYTENKTEGENEAILVDELGTVIAVMSGIELIDTTVKSVESVLEQQTSIMPDLWEESWRGKQGPMQHRIPQQILSENVYDKDFQKYMDKTYNSVPEEMEDIFVKLEEFVYYWILNGLYECGWNSQVGYDSFTVNDLLKELKIGEGYTRYVKYFLGVLEQHEIIKLVEEGSSPMWKVICVPPSLEEVQQLLKQPFYTDELVKRFDPTRLIQRVGENLSSIFKGEQSPLQVLFPEDTKNNPSVAGFYDDYGSIFNIVGSISDVQRQRLHSWLERMKNDRHEEDGKFVFRILEVGAGTGIFTSHVLPVIDELGVEVEYTYTDISPAFFAAAEKRFENFKGSMKFRKLNIEEDPISQGFSPGYYDYAIASDVIHATKDVCSSLRNVRKLLRSGGNFDILEQIQKNRMLTFIFGLMDGFWRFQDFRQDHCTLTSSSWEQCLEESGFERVITFPSFNNRHGLITSWAAESRATDVPTNISRITNNTTWLIFSNPGCKLSSFIRKELKLASRQAVIVEPANSQDSFQEVSSELFRMSHTSKANFEQIMDILKARKTLVEGVIYLRSLDRAKTSQDEILRPYFYIAQSIYSLKQKVTPRLIAVAQGISPVGDNDLSHFHPSTLWGFTKVLRNEDIDINSRCISITNEVTKMTEEEMKEVYNEIWCDDKEPQVAYSQGSRYVARFQPVPFSSQELPLPPGTNRFKLILPETKSISDLQFGPLEPLILAPEEVEIHVKASALNFRDVFSVLKPTEQFKDINSVGFDFAGVVNRVGENVSKWKVGDYVFGVNVKGAPLPSHLKLHEDDVLGVPDNMTLCEAATLPAVVSTAYYCLIDVAKLKPEDTVLIHTASGGVGLSSIEVIKSIGASIIATAGSKRKQNYLRSLGIKHIFNSRNTNYGDEILKVTNGRGVDVVLNSLTSEGFKEATLKACAQGARFVEMSKLSIWTSEEVKALRPDVQYTIVDISSESPEEWRRLIGSVKKLADNKIVKPIPHVRFDGVNIREALQYLQKAKHIGKVVCVMPEVRLENGEYKAYTPMFNDRSTYLITGGLGGIGFQVAKWMVKKGAKHLILASRNPPTPTSKVIIDQLNREGAHIIPVQLDVANYTECKELLHKIESSGDLCVPPLRGIMHAAGILKDGLIVNQDWDKLSSTFNAKIDGTLNLHNLTLGYPLEHFVVFSSITALMGTPGQANHAGGNAFEDSIAHFRHSIGLPVTTVNWGQWGEVGVATEVELPGMKPLSTLQGISALEHIMKTQRVQTSVMNMESFVLFSKLSPQTAVYLDERIWKSGSSSSSSIAIKSDEFWQQYDSKEEIYGKVDLIKSLLKDILRKILKLDREEGIEDDANFQEMGVDSLMFVEIKNAVQALLGDRITVSAAALRDCNTTRLLSEQLIKLIEGDESTCELERTPTLEEVAELLLEDCHLPDHISANGRDPLHKTSEIGSVLLTGATGTLGPYLLKELSNLPQISEIYCLIRPSKTQSPQERMNQVLEFRKLLDKVDMSKIRCVVGNVAKPKLGMEQDVWNDLIEKVDAVFHCAVKADHTEYYKKRGIEDVRNVNVDGTKNVLEFVCEGNLKHVYFASSLLSVATTEGDGTLSESWPQIGDFDGVTKFAYANSKFVGDILMREAAYRGVPVKVVRLPLIAGNSETGQVNIHQNHLILRYLFIMKHGIMPTNPFPVVVLPVDTLASVSIELFFNEKLSGKSDIFNITHPSPNLDQAFFPAIADGFGYKVQLVDFSEFTQRLLSEPEGSTFSMFKEMYKNEDELMAVYSIASSLQKWLEGVENFWVSKKVSAALPGFYSGRNGEGLESTEHTLERDLSYVRREGWFEKFGLQS